MKSHFVQASWLITLLTMGVLAYSNELTNIQFNPASPASLDWNEKVYISFDYQTEETEGIRVHCTAYSTTASMNTAVKGGSLLSGATGSNETYFLVLSGTGTVDTVILRMKSEATGNIIYETKIENLEFSFPKVAGGEDAPYPRCQDTRIVPHVTAYEGLFDTTVIIENFSDFAQSFELTPYDGDGSRLYGHIGSLDPHGTAYYPFEDIFPPNQTAYFEINQEAQVLVSVAYTSKINGSSAFSRERCMFSKKWALLPGNWNLVFDGLAVINMGDAPADLVLTQYDMDHNLIQTQVIASELAPGEKVLYVLSNDFDSPNQTQFVLESEEKLSVLALSGSLPGSDENFLWENTAYPLE